MDDKVKPSRLMFAAIAVVAFASSLHSAPFMTADITVSGYAGASPLTNFPVLVRISPSLFSGFSYADCAAAGADIAFEDEQGNTLPREIDTWNTAGESLVWVRIPTLTNNAVFKMTYNDSSVTVQPACQTDGSVWGPAGYIGVWHMNEINPGDSSPKGYDGTAQSANISTTAGILGSAVNMPYLSTSDRFSFGATPNSEITQGVSLECWFKISAYPGSSRYAIFAKYNFLEMDIVNSTSFRFTARGVKDMKWETASYPANAWVHLITTFRPSGHTGSTEPANTDLKWYLNGVLEHEQPAWGFASDRLTDNAELRIGAGCSDPPKYNYKGLLDEVRMAGVVHSADWVAASYATQANAAFLSYGAAHSTLSAELLTIAGDPSEVGAPSPAYGQIEGLSVGAPLTLSMAATNVVNGAAIAHLLGWKLENIDPVTTERTLVRTSSDSGETIDQCEYVFSQSAVFTWLWDVTGVGAPELVESGCNALTLSAPVSGIGNTVPSATLKFVYGVSPDAMTCTNVVSPSVTAAGTFTNTLTRLAPGTVYYVKAIVENNDAANETAESEVVCIQSAPAGDDIPAGYTLIDYIEGSGAQWIDTDYRVTPYTRTVIDAQLTSQSGTTPHILGVEKVASGSGLIYSLFQNSSMIWAYSYKDDSANNTSTQIPTDTQRHLFDFNYSYGAERAMIIDGGTLWSGNLANKAGKMASYTLALGASRTATGAEKFSQHRIFSCRMYEDAMLVRDFVPVKRLSDSVAGLYDRVFGVFYPSAGSTAYIAGPEVRFVASEVFSGGALTAVSLAFTPDGTAARTLSVAWGPACGGDDPADWFRTNAVAQIAADASEYVWPVPADWGSDTNLVARFFFDGDPVDWSNPVFWRDYSAPSVSAVALDGTGGDTLLVSGTLDSFPGADCALSVFTGDSPETMTNAWTNLAGGVRDATGAFTLTLFESDTNAVRYLAPDSTVYATIQAVSGGRVTRTAPLQVTMKGVPGYTYCLYDVSQRTVTFNNRIVDPGMCNVATGTIYIGPAGATEDALVAAESVQIDEPGVVTVSHTFPDFDTTYTIQMRVSATSAGQTASLDERTSVLSITTSDTATYTWKQSVLSGNWSDAANWDNDKNDDCLGYPKSSGAKAVFTAGTDANVVFTEKLTINTLDMSTGPNVTFSQGGASTNATKLTVTTLTMHNNKSRDGSITLDGVAIASTSGNTYLDMYRTLHVVNGANLYIEGYFYHRASNDVVVAGESLLSCKWSYFGGGTLTISNATFWTRGADYVGNQRPGGHVIFQGNHPLMYHEGTLNSFFSDLATANVQLDFLVPVGGYTAAPIQAKATPSYRMGNSGNNPGACPLTVNVLDESPANHTKATISTPLISWPKNSSGTKGGISRTMVLEGQLPLSKGQDVTDDEFVWGDESDYPSTLGVVIRGLSPLSERATKIMLE